MPSDKSQSADVEFLKARGWIELPESGTLALWRWRDPLSPAALFTLRDAVSRERTRKRPTNYAATERVDVAHV